MLVVTLVSLYTSRIILKALGIDDYGIYNVAGGVIAFISMLTSVMANSTQRYLNIYKGNEDYTGLSLMMNISAKLHIFIGIILLVIGETIGLYVVAELLYFPENRYFAAIMVYQASLIALVFAIFKTPYTSLVITYEKFSFIAFLSLFDVSVKLLVAYGLLCINIDSLILYGFSFSIIEICLYVIYKFYCRKLYIKQKIKTYAIFKSPESKNLLKFSLWSLIGSIGTTCANQGISVMLNFFFALSVNAAMGITNQVTNVLATFVNNVQLAFRPQLLQSYTNKDGSFTNLICTSAKWSFALLMIICVPIVCNLHFILKIWLGAFPYYAYHFIIILILFLIVDSLSTPLSFGIEATGIIERYQIYSFLIMLLNVLLAWLACSFHLMPPYVILTKIIANILIIILRLKTLSRLSEEFTIYTFYCNCIRQLFPLILYTLICSYISIKLSVGYRLFFSTIIYAACLIPLFYSFCMNEAEKQYAKRFLLTIKCKIFKEKH